MNTLVFVGSSSFVEHEHKIPNALVKFSCLIPKNLMHEGNYTINRLLFIENKGAILYEYGPTVSFEILRKTNYYGWQGSKEGIVRPNLNWDLDIENS
jgi:lipopolysaccharide transport system ATP-binding protein